ncbi:MAG: class I adenylate-forming enzyme family protein [Planctomycetota bacterium]
MVDRDAAYTYAALWQRVLAIAGGLPIEPGDRVVLNGENSADFVASYYGILRAGGIVVAHGPPDDCDARLVLDGQPPTGQPPHPPDTEIAALQYTSGTTGTAKGVILSHENLVANALQNARWFGWTRGEVVLGFLPLYHIWGMCICMHSTFAVGGTLVLDDGDVLDQVARHGATVLYGSATMFHRLLDLPTRAVPTLRHVKAGAMLTQGDLKQRWDARYPHAPLQQGYGLTEASPECHNNPPRRFKPGTVGIPVQDTDCRLVDGEVQLKGPQVTCGYWNRPEETAAAFDDGWLKTGDLGTVDDEGYLTIVDRLKDLLKFRGWSVIPNAVESCLLEHPAVREAIVVGRRDERDGDVPVAFVVCDDVADDALRDHCRARLERYEVPREFRRVDEIPKNHVGKPLRRLLRDRLPGASGA